MNVAAQVLIPIGGEGLLQEALNKALTGLVVAVIVWYGKEFYEKRENKRDRLD